MPLDPSIALQGKPVQIETIPATDLFKTLATIKYLQANTDAATQKAAREEELFHETAAAGQYLSSLGKSSSPTAPPPAAPPQLGVTGGPPFSDEDLRGLKQGESTPPPGTPVPAGPGQGAPGAGAPAPRRPTIFDSAVQAELHRIAPHAAGKLIDEHQKMAIATLEGQQKLYENVARGLQMVTDQPTYDAWRLAATTSLAPDVAGRLPTTWTPDLVPKLLAGAQSLTTTFDQTIAKGKLANETLNAKTGQQTVELQGREYLAIQTEDGYKLVPKYGPAPGAGPGSGTGPGSAPPIVNVPDSARPRTAEETKAAARFDQAAKSNARLAVLEAEIASGGTDPSKDPQRDSQGLLKGEGINTTTPAQRQAELDQYLANTPQRKWNEYGANVLLSTSVPPATNAPDTYTGKGLIRVVPSVAEDALAHGAGQLSGAVGGATGGVLGTVTGGPWGTAVGANAGERVGSAVGNTVGANVAHKALDTRRQQYYGEQLNFIAAVRGEETSRLTPEVIDIERRRYFPQPGDTEAEVLRKRQVREDALSGMATQTNRRQGSVPVGQKRVDEGSGSAGQTPQGGPRIVTMDELRAAAKQYGKTLDEAITEAVRQRWIIQ